ncbi:carboxyesterase -like protein [Staphylococcus aureus]|nr:carboxyesterase -like protein [Staphylococcus aureus]
MQIKLPKPFFFEEGKRAVLLLHGFTGNSSDVRQLGRFLQKRDILRMHHNTKVMQHHQKRYLNQVLLFGLKMR